MACGYLDSQDYDDAIQLFERIGNYKNSEDLVIEANYSKGLDLFNNKEYMEALAFFEKTNNYKDSKSYREKIMQFMSEQNKSLFF